MGVGAGRDGGPRGLDFYKNNGPFLEMKRMERTECSFLKNERMFHSFQKNGK